MKKKQRMLVILLAGFVMFFSGGTIVLAQKDSSTDSEEVMLEEIIVTGSNIRRSEVESMSPITVFSETEILASGYTTLEDFVQNIPSNTGGFFGGTVNNGNPGYATTSLRGLGSNRTLVLVNGKRMPSAGSNGFVDLNMIPVGMVERVEVLRDGASTIYGSDAIAGVVNIITKSDFKGAEFQYQYDITGEGDGNIQKVSGLFGGSSDRGSVVFGVEYTKREEIWQKDRQFSECPLYEDANGDLYCGGSGTSYPAQFWSTTTDNYDGHILVDETIVPFNSAEHAYNFASASYMVTPQSVLSTYANGRYDLIQESAIGSVTIFAESMWTNRQSDQLMAAVGTFWGPDVPATNPYNPTDEPLGIARRLYETGGRHSTQDASAWRLVSGLEGEFNNGWTWNISYNYSRWVDSRINYGYLNVDRTDNILDPDLCAADPACPGVWDPFRTDTLTEELQNYILVNHSPVQRSQMQTLNFNLSGDLGGIEIPTGGPIQWAVGYEDRKEEALFQPDGAGAMNLIYYVSPDRTEGKYSVKEFYGEVRVPILEEQPFADILATEISVRNSDYDNLDDKTTNWKYALEWGPIPALRFRTVYSEGFRSANIAELFGPQEQSAQNYNDPCINYGSGANAIVTANCAADGLAPDFQLSSNQATSIFGGNPDLEPEESESWTFGIVISPESMPFSITLDYFNISIENAVGTAGTDNVITGCYNSENFSSPWCDLIAGPTHPIVNASPHQTSPYRDALSSVSGVLLTNANLADYETEGLDFAINYVWELGPNGVLNLGVMGTYLSKYDYTPFEGADVVEMAGYFGEDQFTGSPAVFPELKLNFNFNYVMGNGLSFTWAPRWFDATTDINADDANAVNKAKAVWYHDIQATYDYQQWIFTLGVRNVLDKEPPYVTNYDDMNTIQYSYDTAGRYMYGRVSYRF